MTLLVGIRCPDGVVIAADQAVTFGVAPGIHTVSHRACKITVLHDQIIVAGTGQVGMKQRFTELVEEMWKSPPGKQGLLRGKTAVEVGRLACNAMIQDFQKTGAPKGAFGALLAFPNPKNEPQLCEFASADFQPELKDSGTWYVSMGSGQSLADPYLAFMRQVYWQNGAPTLRKALFAATWVMQQSIAVAPGYVSMPIDVAVLEGSKAKMLTQEEIAVHLDAAEAATRHFAEFDPEKLAASGDPAEAGAAVPGPG